MAELKKNSKYEIFTPHGWCDFDGIRRSKSDTLVHLEGLDCTPDHKILTMDGFVEARSLVNSIEVLDDPVWVYDPLQVNNKDHSYCSGNYISHNCEFLGSAHTLISPAKLKELAFFDPEHKTDFDINIFETPKAKHSYMIAVDVSRGVHLDFSAFTVIDVTDYPQVVVATYKDNNITPLLFPNVIYQAAKMYNDAMVIVEINDAGQQVVDILAQDLEYENIMTTVQKTKKAQTLSAGFGKGTNPGLRMTAPVKRLGCFTLKSLIENQKLKVNDFRIIEELVNFVAKNNSYEADTGFHDDLVMCLVIHSWAVSQRYFKELTDLDVRKKLYDDQMKQMEEETMPFGIIDDGLDNIPLEPYNPNPPRIHNTDDWMYSNNRKDWDF